MTQIAIVGTAGRDHTMPLTPELWDWMLDDASRRVPVGCDLVSGGAAWADHLAVALFLCGHAKSLTLYLPARFAFGKFVGYGKCASSANFHHANFSRIIGQDSLAQLQEAIDTIGCRVEYAEQQLPGFQGFFERNLKVAQSENLIAYTFGTGLVPADGGTKHTWDNCKNHKVHVSLPKDLAFEMDEKV